MISMCYRWGESNFKWNTGDWTWSECQLVRECIQWGIANGVWKNAGWMWPECSGSFVPPTDCVKWNTGGQTWDKANWFWNGCSGSYVPPEPPIPVVLVEQPPGVDATTLIQPWLIEPWNPFRAGEKKKKFVRLICKVKGIDYDESKYTQNFDITIDDVKLVVDKSREIGVNIFS